ncbi:MAG: hypothetical protein HOO91_12670 [Bacteroidales bacterium]|nr:hypothetical protein [Bacteroidales bacterium]
MKTKLMKTKPLGYVLKSDGTDKRIFQKEIHYNHDIEIVHSGYASPITESVAQVLINNFRKTPSSPNADNIGVIFAIKDLLSIFHQKDCTGVSFYFARRRVEDFDQELSASIKPGITLVAVGSKIDESDIMTNLTGRLGAGLNGSGNINGFPEDIGVEPVQNGIIMEMVPPIRDNVKDLIELLGEKIVGEMVEYFIKHNEEFVKDCLRNK